MSLEFAKEELTFILICHFGLEKILKSEVRNLGFAITDVVDGEVKVKGTINDIPKLNYNLRTAERVMIEINSFKAMVPDELYENAKKCEIEKFVPINGEFPVTKANQDKNSVLKSSMANQKTVKKAFVERLKNIYKTDVLSEDKGKYPFRVKFNKNICSIRLDTTGDSLHKRGYRIKAGLAPIEETLAAALIKLVEYKKGDILVDPFCGSGTIPIEAALITRNMPVSIDRAFVSETWDIIDKSIWKNERDIAIKKIYKNDEDKIKIYGFDIDSQMIKIANENAKRAGVDDIIHFEVCDIKDLASNKIIKDIIDDEKLKLNKKIILTNPPYGVRLEDKDSVVSIYENLKKVYDELQCFDMNIITSFENMQKIFGKEHKNRKIYNGMIKTYIYSYLGSDKV